MAARDGGRDEHDGLAECDPVGPGSTATDPYADLPADRLAETGAAAFLLGQVIYNTGGQYGPIGRAH